MLEVNDHTLFGFVTFHCVSLRFKDDFCALTVPRKLHLKSEKKVAKACVDLIDVMLH